LVRQSSLKKLEARASTARRVAGGVGIVWSRDDVRVVRALEPGELVAVDMTILEPAGESPAAVRMVERVTLDPCDLGFVYDAGGAVIGRMTELDGSLLTWEACAPLARALVLGAPPEPPRPPLA
jgi:hypothetical protein